MNEANGNGQANGNGGIFGLTPKPDPMLSQFVPAARKRVAVMHKLSFGARNFFHWLTDQSLTPGSNITKGVLKISDHDAAVRFKVHSKTIRNWKRELESTGELWLTEKWMKNSFPQTVYNITAIVGQATLPMDAHSSDGSLVDDEVFSSNRRRQQSAKRDPHTGKFAKRLTPPRVLTPGVSPDTLQNQAENGPSEKILPPTTATGCRPPRQQVAAHHGNGLPSPTATHCRPARQQIAVADGNALPPTTATGCRGEGKSVAGNGKTESLDLSVLEGGKGNPTPTDESEAAFRKWCLSWEGAYRSKLEKELSRVKSKLMAGPSDFWQCRADFLREALDGGKAPTKTAPAVSTPTKTTQPARLAPGVAKQLWAKAKADEKNLPAATTPPASKKGTNQHEHPTTSKKAHQQQSARV